MSNVFSCDVYPFLKIIACLYSLIFAFALESTSRFEKAKTVIVRVSCVAAISGLQFIVYCRPNMPGHVSH